MSSSTNCWKDLVISMLSVYRFSLEKVDALADQLEENGLFDPINLHKFNHEQVFAALEKSGYKRGDLNAIFTERLLALGSHVDSKGVAKSEQILNSTKKKEISDFLIKIKGVGPKVIENYFTLREMN